jgi:hypothetical protein
MQVDKLKAPLIALVNEISSGLVNKGFQLVDNKGDGTRAIHVLYRDGKATSIVTAIAKNEAVAGKGLLESYAADLYMPSATYLLEYAACRRTLAEYIGLLISNGWLDP